MVYMSQCVETCLINSVASNLKKSEALRISHDFYFTILSKKTDFILLRTNGNLLEGQGLSDFTLAAFHHLISAFHLFWLLSCRCFTLFILCFEDNDLLQHLHFASFGCLSDLLHMRGWLLRDTDPPAERSSLCVPQLRKTGPIRGTSAAHEQWGKSTKPCHDDVIRDTSTTGRSVPLLLLSHMIHWGVWCDWLTVLYRFYPNHKPRVHSNRKHVLHKYI